MTDSKSIIDHIDDSLVLVSRLNDWKVDVSESLQVAAVIAKVLTTWNNYRKKLLHTYEDLTMD